MTFTLSAAAKANLDKLAVAAKLGGSIGGPSDMNRIAISGSGKYEKTQFTKIEDYATTFGMTLLPSAVKLALSNAIVQGASGEGNVTTSYIDCNAWTQSIQEIYDSDKWMTPVSYSFVPITSIFTMPDLFPSEIRPALPSIKAALNKFINSCVYDDPAAISIMGNASSIHKCPDVGLSRCLPGTGQQKRHP